ncbi:MAG: DAK2 domain-containing protein [Bacteroidota bacterium]
MKTLLTLEDFVPLTGKIAGALNDANEQITALDAAIGDGDLGVTCRLGMQAALDSPAREADSLSEAVLKAGMAFNSSAASTFGALVATAAMRAAKYAKDKALTEWDLPAIIGAAEATATGIKQRGGGAELGDKTMLDALIPATEALKAAEAAGKSLAEALSAAAAAAQAGAEATKPLKSKFGRAGWLQDQTIGVQDPGATVVAIVMQALADYVREA